MSTVFITSMSNKIRFFSPNQILIGSFFGGPFAITYFLARNYMASGYPEMSSKAISIGTCMSVLAITVLSLLPPYTELFVFAAVLSMGTGYHIAIRQQRSLSDQSITENSKSAVALIAICSFIALMIVITLCSIALDYLGLKSSFFEEPRQYLILP